MLPEVKDRLRGRHGGVMIYVKDTLFHERRYDLEPLKTECIWTEFHPLIHVFGLFYRISAPTIITGTPPIPHDTHSDMTYHSRIDDSILLALETQIRNVIVSRDEL